MPRIAVVMTCHDRREKTLRCLASLPRAVDVFLTDDGSTDGTGEAVRRFASEGRARVHLVAGSGRDFWARGMARAWRAALECEKGQGTAASAPRTFAAFLWLNDDVELKPGALERMAGTEGDLVVGRICDADGRKIYGLQAGGRVEGNCVLVRRTAFQRLGILCGQYSHAWADTEYGLRARRAGLKVAETDEAVGVCEWHPIRPELAGRSLRERFALLSDPKGWCVRDLWLYRRRNWGFCAAVGSCLHLIVHVATGRKW